MTNSGHGPETSAPRMHNDEPSDKDGLGRKGYVDAFSEIATTCQTPTVIGLYGRWGVGKTSLMRQIEKQLVAEKSVHTVWFDPWMHQFDEHPVLALMHTMVDTLELGPTAKAKLKTIAWSFGKSIIKRITEVDAGDVESALARDKENNFELSEERVRLYNRFNELIDEGKKAKGLPNRRIIFFIDDLDRCLPANTLNVLEALKLFLNFDECVYFVGADRDALESSIRYHYGNETLDHTGYLDKIVQVPFNIPPIARKSMDDFIKSLLPDDLSTSKEILELGLSRNPRSVKRFINNLWLNYQLAKVDFNQSGPYRQPDPKVLAILLLIQDRSPELYQRITRDPGLFSLLFAQSEEGTEIRKTHIPDDEEWTKVLGLQGLEVIAKLEDPETESYVTLTDASPIKFEAVLDPDEDVSDSLASIRATGLQDVSRFLTHVELDQVLRNSGSIIGEDSPTFLLLFRTKTQSTWLATTKQEIFCLLDDEKTRRGGRVIQWRQTLSEANSVYAYVSNKGTALIDIGLRKRWIYSRRLHPDGVQLVKSIESMIEQAKLGLRRTL